jgi:hypothetical protein
MTLRTKVYDKANHVAAIIPYSSDSLHIVALAGGHTNNTNQSATR